MKRLWAPWRIQFVQEKNKNCVFCEVQQEGDDPSNLVLWHGKTCFVLLNRFPYTTGHLLVVANAHLPTLEALNATTRTEMMETASHGMTVLRNVYEPDGFNFGANIGASAGAGISGHVHLHVVPRWTGDANFMLTLAETKVIPEALTETYKRLRQAWDAG